MGDVRVPAAARWGAQTQRAVENFPISGQSVERRSWPARADQGRRGRGERRDGRHRPRRRRGDRRRRLGGRRGHARRTVPRRRLPDRLGHVDEHEHERGPGPPRERAARAGDPPERRGERVAVLERHVPLRHPPRRGTRDHRRPRALAPPPRRGAPGEAGRVRHGREVGSDPPHGRHAGDARPGVRRLRGGRRARHRAARGLPRQVGELPLGGTAVGTGLNASRGSPRP